MTNQLSSFYDAVIEPVRRALFIFVLLICSCFFSHAQSILYNYKIKYLTVDEGLSHTDALDVIQDNKGFIWIATYFGLDRFDGNAVRRFYNDNEPLKNALKNRITTLSAAPNGDIWLGTEGGIQRFDVRSEQYIDYTVRGTALSNISKIYKLADNQLYCMADGEIYRFKTKGNTLVRVQNPVLKNFQIKDMKPDAKGNLLLMSNNGLGMLNKAGLYKSISVPGLDLTQFDELELPGETELLVTKGNEVYRLINDVSKFNYRVAGIFRSPHLRKIKNVIKDSKGDYWVNDGQCLQRLNSKLSLLQTVDNRNPGQQLKFTAINKIMVDRSQCLWAATISGGINYFDLNVKPFYSLFHIPGNNNTLSESIVKAIVAQGDSLWIGTVNGLDMYNLKTKKYIHFNNYNSPVRLKSDFISSLALDDFGNLWISHAAGIEILDRSRKKTMTPSGYDKFPQMLAEAMTLDCFGNMWLGNHKDSLTIIWKDNKNSYHVKRYREKGFSIYANPDKPEVFVSTIDGLLRFIIDKKGNILSRTTYLATGGRQSISSNYVLPVMRQNDSVVWVGTIGGGLNRLRMNKAGVYQVTTYSKNKEIFQDVESIQIDQAGRLWMGGNGLQCFDPQTSLLVKYDKNDGLQGNSFKVGASFKGADGCLYFGGVNGLNYFYPDEIKPANIPSRPTITDILINNQRPKIAKQGSSANTIHCSTAYLPELDINHSQNNVVVSFSAMLFANPLKCRYKYKMEGYDKNWRYTDGQNPTAAYSNLDFKKYKFIVRATNNDGKWSDYQAEMDITVNPPWWKSGIAKLFYGLVFLSFLVGIYNYRLRLYKLKRDIETRKLQEKQREELHRQKEELHQQQLSFFTNISHEFRTPLTLIIGPLENLMDMNSNTSLDSSYHLIYRNAKRLMNLITELMNFKKIGESVIKLSVQYLDVHQFSRAIVKEFENIAINKNISLTFENKTGIEEGELNGFFDAQVLEKILFNLLDNALKYTKSNGCVSLTLLSEMETYKSAFASECRFLNTDFRADKYLYFRVADTGIGISSDSINLIFDRYYRVNSQHLGSGVGLALVKSLTKLHHGDIYVFSEWQAGTEIIIGIPWGRQYYRPDELSSNAVEVAYQLEPIDKSLVLSTEQEIFEETGDDIKRGNRILIVEDNHELRSFLRQILEKQYIIFEAEDGKDGYRLAVDKLPDVIISDVMMPEINGMELCKMVKEKFETRHIPFIVLSAKDSLQAKLDGLGYGADFYFSKPLSIDLLLLTIKNILEQREVLKTRFLNDYHTNAAMLVKSDVDKQFFDKLTRVINDNISNAYLDVDFICDNLFMSRTTLYRKIKSVTDSSIGEFIRTLRLKKSVEIMTHENISMNEVAIRIGMQSSSNFSRAFKKEYGKSPLQYMQALKLSSTGK